MAATTNGERRGRRGRGAAAALTGAASDEPQGVGRPVANDRARPNLAADQVAVSWDQTASVGRSNVTDFVVLSMKMRRAEADAFRALCAELDVSMNRALRTMARHASGYLEIGGTIEDELRTAVRQLRGIATNVNQIAKAANRTRTPDYVDFIRERAALGPVLLCLSIQCRRILDVSARRLDGRERLKAVLGQPAPAENMVNKRA